MSLLAASGIPRQLALRYLALGDMPRRHDVDVDDLAGAFTWLLVRRLRQGPDRHRLASGTSLCGWLTQYGWQSRALAVRQTVPPRRPIISLEDLEAVDDARLADDPSSRPEMLAMPEDLSDAHTQSVVDAMRHRRGVRRLLAAAGRIADIYNLPALLPPTDPVESNRLRQDLADDARLRPWEATIPPGTGEELHRFRQYVRLQSRQARRGEAMPFVIEADGDFAGQLTVAPIHWGSLSAASLGYWIGSPWEGRGVVTLSAAMVLDHLLGPEVGLHRVEIDVRPENARSLAVCRRLGLHEEGLRRGLMHIDGAWADHLSFAVLAEDVAGQPGFVARLAERGAERWAWSRGSDAVGSALWRLRRS